MPTSALSARSPPLPSSGYRGPPSSLALARPSSSSFAALSGGGHQSSNGATPRANGDYRPPRSAVSNASSSYPAGDSTSAVPPPLTISSAGPPAQGPSVVQILAMGSERNHAADLMAHHPRIESLIKLGKESEATWMQIASTAETLGDVDRAVAAYESALRHNAYSVDALTAIAAICRSREEFKKAAEYFGRVVGIAPESGDIWGALGHCYLMIDDLKKAYSSYQQALYYMPNPQEPKLWYGIGILYDRYGSLEHAEEAFSSVIRMDPAFEKANEIFFRLGIIYKQQRKSAQSLECFRYILQNPPRPLTEIDIWFQIGHVYEQQKDFIAAKDSYERVLAENPAHAKVLQQLGGLYQRSRAPFYNPELSVSILTKSLESDPNDAFSWYLLGRAYMTTSNFGKAYEAYQQAVYRDGKNPAFWCSIGVLYYKINQFHDALDAYSRAIRIHPFLAEVWFNLGALYESCNDQMTDAIDAYQRTVQLDPTNSVVIGRLREIREHQSTGASLGAPPIPKDISPSSLSWNYATNAGGALAYLAQSGLGPELNPALARSGPTSPPPTGHRFDQPSSRQIMRPRSSDQYRGGLPSEDRRRPSTMTQHHSPSAESSGSRLNPPPPSHSFLPNIKPIHDHRIPSPSNGSHLSELQRMHSPPSPRIRRHSDIVTDHGYAGTHSYHPDGASSSQTSFNRGSGPDHSEMDWERTGGPRNGGGHGRHSAHSHRRSPPESQTRDPYSYGPPPNSSSHQNSGDAYDRRVSPTSHSSRPLPLDDRDPDQRGASSSAQAYPYGGGHHHSQQHANSESSGARGGASRYEPHEVDERRRNGTSSRGGDENSPRVAQLSPTGERHSPSNGSHHQQRHQERLSPPAHSPSGGAGADRSSASSSSAKKEGTTPVPKAERKTKGAKAEGSEAAGRGKRRTYTRPTPRRGGDARSHDPVPIAPLPQQDEGTPDEVAPAPGPSREVDEDYDEGVDALMELASHERSPPLPAVASAFSGPLVMDPAFLPPLPALSTPPLAPAVTSPVVIEVIEKEESPAEAMPAETPIQAEEEHEKSTPPPVDEPNPSSNSNPRKRNFSAPGPGGDGLDDAAAEEARSKRSRSDEEMNESEPILPLPIPTLVALAVAEAEDNEVEEEVELGVVVENGVEKGMEKPAEKETEKEMPMEVVEKEVEIEKENVEQEKEKDQETVKVVAEETKVEAEEQEDGEVAEA